MLLWYNFDINIASKPKWCYNDIIMTHIIFGVDGMKLAIIGSRGLLVEDLENYIHDGVEEIVSGGAKGIDACAKKYALENGKILTEFLPDYRRYKKGAPLVRNVKIVEYADEVLAFWDGKSRGTKFVIDKCISLGKKINVVVLHKR